ncbi:hypothetical protein T484DRAFT_1855074 [Baffinella frigidus]|nr:hypothetical protein T484DRAFT_1855074 [Cryptophyta sp. CCMP2293]
MGSSDASMCSTTVDSSFTCQNTPITLPPATTLQRFLTSFMSIFRRPSIALLTGTRSQGTAIKRMGFILSSPYTSSDPELLPTNLACSQREPSRDMRYPTSSTRPRLHIETESMCEQPTITTSTGRASSARAHAESTREQPKSTGRRHSLFGWAEPRELRPTPDGSTVQLKVATSPIAAIKRVMSFGDTPKPVRNREAIKEMSRRKITLKLARASTTPRLHATL